MPRDTYTDGTIVYWDGNGNNIVLKPKITYIEVRREEWMSFGKIEITELVPVQVYEVSYA